MGCFATATAEEAALCFARSPVAAERAAAAPPLTSEEVLQQAQAEGLVLRVGRSGTGYLGVHLTKPGYPKPYQARVRRGGKKVHLGSFATAEEAALCIARSLEWMARRSKVGAALAAAKRAEAWAQRVQNDEAEVGRWSQVLAVQYNSKTEKPKLTLSPALGTPAPLYLGHSPRSPGEMS